MCPSVLFSALTNCFEFAYDDLLFAVCMSVTIARVHCSNHFFFRCDTFWFFSILFDSFCCFASSFLFILSSIRVLLFYFIYGLFAFGFYIWCVGGCCSIEDLYFFAFCIFFFIPENFMVFFAVFFTHVQHTFLSFRIITVIERVNMFQMYKFDSC